MKKFTLIAILGCIMAAVSFTSCNSDSDSSYQSLTPAEVQQCFLATQGYHNGKMIYPSVNKANINDKNDTVQVSWAITTDSTMTIYNFPSKAVAEAISGNDELKNAIANHPSQAITCAIGYVYVTPIQFLIGPKNVTYNVEYGGSSHKVELLFYWNNYSFGQYVASAKYPMQMQIFAAQMKVDGNQTSYGITPSSPVQYFFYTEK